MNDRRRSQFKRKPSRRKGAHRHRILDSSMEWLIYFSIVMAPWAFGTVHPLPINVLNLLGCILGVLVLIRMVKPKIQNPGHQRTLLAEPRIKFLAGLSALLLLYILIHALNYRAEFATDTLTFEFNESYIGWLPHSYNRAASWGVFWQYLALAGFFWATITWLSTTDPGDAASRKDDSNWGPVSLSTLSDKARKLILVIAINASLLALVGTLQKLSGTNKLLWLYEPTILRFAEQHFGPFAYRGNAATFLNMAWPIALCLLIDRRSLSNQRRSAPRFGSDPSMLLIPFLFFLTISPAITNSRAGFLMLIAMGTVTLSLFFFTSHAKRLFLKFSLPAIAVLVVGAWVLGAGATFDRIKNSFDKGLGSHKTTRMDIYQHFGDMVRNTPYWGSGPGSFTAIYQMHRKPALNVRGWKGTESHRNDRLVSWAAWAHCDPLEYLITFGSIGSLILLISLCAVVIPFGWPKHRNELLVTLILRLAIIGIIIHSCIDFPFQVYSLLHAFVILCALTLACSYGTQCQNRAREPQPPSTSPLV